MALDFESENFDPSLALSSFNLSLPDPEAKPMKNLAEYYNAMKGITKTTTTKKVNQPSTSREEYQKTASNPIRFDCTRQKKRIKNVLTIMEKISGPLGCLRQCMKESIRIKVWTRRSHEMRGMCQGYVLAFDRHWNIVLGDVDEIYLLPKHAKLPPRCQESDTFSGNAMGEYVTHNTSCQEDLLIIASRRGAITKQQDKFSVRQRHIDQLFIRGDGIAFVSISNIDTSSKTSDVRMESATS